MTPNASSLLTSVSDRLLLCVASISGLDSISGDDNFFRAGLSSIMLTRLKQNVENDFGVDVPMRLFYNETDSVNKLAQYISGHAREVSGISDFGTPLTPEISPAIKPVKERSQSDVGPRPEGMLAIFNEQLDVMNRQLDLLASQALTPAALEPFLPEESGKKNFPLSSAQKRIYFLSQLEEGEEAYHITAAAIIEGNLDIGAFKRAFEKLIHRHESLRTGFETRGDELVQQVHKISDFHISEFDMDSDDPHEVIRDFVLPFDLTCPPLIRVGLGSFGQNRHFLVMDAHHIAIDGYSFNILMPELIKLYNGDHLPPVSRSYSSYAVWEQEQIKSIHIKQQESYWLERFHEDAPVVLELPLDTPRGRYQSFSGKVIRHTLDQDLTKQLKNLARESGVTLFMLLLSAYNILLAKLSGQNDIVVGTPIDSRFRGDFQNTVGLFSNTLALRSKVRDEMTFAQYLDGVKQDSLKAFDHQDYPFDQLVEKLGLEGSLNRNPLFDVMFVYENEEDRMIRTGDLLFKAFDIDLWTTNFDFILEVMESSESLNIHLIYNTALFEGDTLERWKDYYLLVLDTILRDPETLLKDFSILSAREKEVLLHEFNHEACEHFHDCSVDETVLNLFERQVQKTPSAIAVIFEDISITFQELNQRAGRMASYLYEMFEVKPGDVIGVLVHPSENLSAILLAVTKLGAAFVPMEPGSPMDRIRYILEDSGARLLVVENEHEVVKGIDIACVPMNQSENSEIIHTFNGSAPQDVFYIIYTSGTTGLPKGTLVSNQSLVNYLKWFRRAFHITGQDRFLLVSSYAFDMAHTSLWVPLIFGSSLYLVSEEDRRDSAKIADYIINQRISCLKVTPSYFYTLTTSVPSSQTGTLSDLRLVVLGGEDIRFRDIETFLDLNPHGVCVNEYGPTEATIACIAHPVNLKNLESVRNRQLIGKPIDNAFIYILDAHGRSVPLGVRGEIAIGGAGVALGYLNREEMTREKFKRDPFKPDGRIYMTGDYGRWLTDGTIEFFGRIDQQVKIRGYRVELGEIEETLLKHPVIDDAVVIAEKLNSFGNELIAYVVSHEKLTSSTLQSFLGNHLPEYMVPAYFVDLPEIPLTPNGKIHRKALPAPLESEGTLSPESTYETPRTSKEKMLMVTWESILGHTHIGIRDNYFALGGDSIKAVLLCARLLKAGFKARVRDIFEAPTIAQLAKRLTASMDYDQRPVTGPAPLFPIQRRFFDLNPVHQAHYNIGVSLLARSPLNPKALKQTLMALQNHHDALRMSYRMKAGRMSQEIQKTDLPVSFEILDLRQKRASETHRRRHLEKVSGSVDLTRGPLMRAVLYQRDDVDELVMIIHHLAVDGISFRILLEDLEKGYINALDNKPVVLAPKTDSVAVFAHCLDEYAKDKNLLSAFREWEQRCVIPDDLQAEPGIDSLDSGNSHGKAQRQVTAFSREETGELMRSLDHNMEINHLLLTALARAAKKSLGMKNFYVDLEGYGRDVPEAEVFKHPDDDRYVDISRTVGWFTTLHPLCITPSEEGNSEADLHAVRASLRDLPAQGLAHGLLHYQTGKYMQNDVASLPVPEIGFNYLGQFDGPGDESLFKSVQELDSCSVGPHLNRWHELEIEGIILNECFEISFIYNSVRFKEKRIQSFLEVYRNEIKVMIKEIAASLTGTGISTKIPQETLEKLMEECRVEPDNLEDIYPLSPLQQGMLFHTIMDKQDTPFFEQFSFDIQGELDIPMFEKSWNHLFDSFEVFRSTFSHRGGDQPYQLVLKKRSLKLILEELCDITEEEGEDRINAFKQADRQLGFDLSRDLLMRVMVFKRGPADYHVIWSHHHIITDGWSCGIMVDTLLKAYAAVRCGGKPAVYAGAPYRNYIEWLSGKNQNQALNYWAEYLSGYVRTVSLSNESISISPSEEPDETLFKPAGLTEAIPADRVETLKCMASENGVTLNSVVQCAWAILLGHYGFSDDVVFGSVVSGRPADLHGVEGMVGLFLNTVPIRVRLNKDDTLMDILKGIQARALESEPYHYVSLADIQMACSLGPDLLNHVLIFENYPLSLEIKELNNAIETGFTVGQVEEFEQINYNLALEIYPDKELILNLKYNAMAYREDQIKGYLNSMSEILSIMGESFDKPLKAVRDALMNEVELDEQETFLAELQDIGEDF